MRAGATITKIRGGGVGTTLTYFSRYESMPMEDPLVCDSVLQGRHCVPGE